MRTLLHDLTHAHLEMYHEVYEAEMRICYNRITRRSTVMVEKADGYFRIYHKARINDIYMFLRDIK